MNKLEKEIQMFWLLNDFNLYFFERKTNRITKVKRLKSYQKFRYKFIGKK